MMELTVTKGYDPGVRMTSFSSAVTLHTDIQKGCYLDTSGGTPGTIASGHQLHDEERPALTSASYQGPAGTISVTIVSPLGVK
jgi:hypothetical protein